MAPQLGALKTFDGAGIQADPQGLTAAAAEASELPRPPEIPQGPNCGSKEAKVPQLGLLKTLEGEGLQADPQGGWERLDGPHSRWADEGTGDESVTASSSPKGAQQAKDRIAWLFCRGCGSRQPRDHVKELEAGYAALWRLVGSEALSITIDICADKADEGHLADSDVVLGWLKSIQGNCSKNPRGGKKGRRGRRPYSPNG